MGEKIACVHIGARAHYLLPKALEEKGKLAWLVTDTWIASLSLRNILKQSTNFTFKSLAGRFTSDIPSQKVLSFGISFLFFEIYLRLFYNQVWQQIIKRNQYFEKMSARILEKNINYDTVLGISYTALEAFKIARKKGKKRILFQIDPAIEEEIIVSKITEKYKNKYPNTWQKAPVNYWNQWKNECTLADIIIVNSEWSKNAIIKHSVATEKIKVISLPIELKPENNDFERYYPEQFNDARPLCCLFLGTLTLRKGIHILLEAAKELENCPIQFKLIGNSELNIDFAQYKNVVYSGVVSREDTKLFYQQSDIFLFPTLSDGFGLTQLEAMSWKLPVIASQYCGKVVSDKVDGFILQQNTVQELSSVLLYCLDNPDLLQLMATHSFGTAQKHNLENFSLNLIEIID